MENLSHFKCVACDENSPTLTDEEINMLHPQVIDWQVVDFEGVNKLKRTFRFKNFAEALTFTNAVGEAAEEEGHHPTILTEWGKVTVTWWTHKIHGLHQNDFIMAAKSDRIYLHSQAENAKM